MFNPSERNYEGLYSGNTEFDWFCGIFKQRYLLFYLTKGKASCSSCYNAVLHPSTYVGCDGPLHLFNGNEVVQLHVSDKRPKFNKNFKVLALKPTGSSYTKEFFPATIVSGPKNKDTRKIYKVKFDNEPSEVKEVYEELIIPPREFWKDQKDSYGVEEEDNKSKKEEKKKEKKEKKKSHHKHRHHHYSNDDYSDSQPQVVIVPIFIPYQQYGMQQQIPYQSYW